MLDVVLNTAGATERTCSESVANLIGDLVESSVLFIVFFDEQCLLSRRLRLQIRHAHPDEPDHKRAFGQRGG